LALAVIEVTAVPATPPKVLPVIVTTSMPQVAVAVVAKTIEGAVIQLQLITNELPVVVHPVVVFLTVRVCVPFGTLVNSVLDW
jgi:hypothetical protein